MKKLLYSSIVLTLFSISILIFQISCQKDATADSQIQTSSSQINKLIFKRITWPINPAIYEIWSANYDGSNTMKINIVLPNGVVFSTAMVPAMSPDGKKIFFTAGEAANRGVFGDIYSCNTDGSSVTKVVDRSGGDIILGGAY